MIAWDQVNTLRDDIGEEDFRDVVGLFLDEMDENVARLDPALAPDAMADLLHFLKGSALNLGFHRFASLCAEGESRLQADAAPQVDPSALKQFYQQSRSAFLSGLDMPLDRAG